MGTACPSLQQPQKRPWRFLRVPLNHKDYRRGLRGFKGFQDKVDAALALAEGAQHRL